MELSRSKWLITSLSPGGGEKISKHTLAGGDLGGLFERFDFLREGPGAHEAKLSGHRDPRSRPGRVLTTGFWKAGIESHVVDPASIAVSRRARRAKTDNIDGEALVRALLAYKARRAGGRLDGAGAEPGGGGLTARPSRAEGADRREGQAINRIKGLLFAPGCLVTSPCAGAAAPVLDASHWRWSRVARLLQGTGPARARPARAATRSDQDHRG
ncbi:hypothetical protein HNQ71_006630 [Mesorhizobium sangaii]|uniref:Uncharacterized protein n=1 Tax=Mesorhizobium sangaii TaxID=505389 RepID=A0A841PIW7_9HYPH|nr:hypothetical protein [Mesorhizobium sangaii]